MKDIHLQADDFKKTKQKVLEETRVFEVNKLNDMEVKAMEGERDLQKDMIGLRQMLDGELGGDRVKTPETANRRKSQSRHSKRIEELEKRHMRQ